MKLLKNRFLMIGLVVAILLSVLPTVLSMTGCTDVVRSGLNVAAKPLRSVFDWVADGIEGFGKYFSGMKKLSDENDRLRRELEEYRAAAARAELAEGENEWLREQLGFVDSNKGLDLTDAKIIGRSSNSYSVTYTLDRGTECGIKPDMAVITSGGICGYIRESGPGYSRFVALTDPTSAVGAFSSTGVYCAVTGSVDHRSDGFCVINGRELAVGTELYSSGYGGIYPTGLPIGRVIEVKRDGFSHAAVSIVKPAVDFDSLTFVMIVRAVNVAEDAD